MQASPSHNSEPVSGRRQQKDEEWALGGRFPPCKGGGRRVFSVRWPKGALMDDLGARELRPSLASGFQLKKFITNFAGIFKVWLL